MKYTLEQYGLLCFLRRKKDSKVDIKELNDRFETPSEDVYRICEELANGGIFKRHAIGRYSLPEDQEKAEFSDEVMMFNDTYKPELLKDFIDYWTEIDKGKMRFKAVIPFNIKRRLSTWSRNNLKYKGDSGKLPKQVTETEYEKLFG